MKNILIVVANPKEDSFSFAMANKYKNKCKEKNYDVEFLDLYRDENQQPFFTNEQVTTKEMKYYQEKISKADEITFVFPYWWGSMPAILKNFIDWNFSNGFAFEYVNSRPHGLLKGKSVKVFTTTGAPYLFYMLTGAHRRLRSMLKEQIIEFCGMKFEEFNIFGGVDTSKKKMQKILDKI
ncbi:NAD(P)H-dependent oxidoreductase [Sulfurimonas sp.]|uniref:NAD(P)H-dependent oxidoreductase n=1 Tax=Sulfurimonas sp. TaxID=2022749 RepID=UPI00356503EE